MNSTNAQAFKEAPEIPWAQRFKGTSVVLMSLMVLGAIDGVVGVGGRSISNAHRIPVSGGVSEFVGSWWRYDFRGRSLVPGFQWVFDRWW
jgi:hypothetical protein